MGNDIKVQLNNRALLRENQGFTKCAYGGFFLAHRILRTSLILFLYRCLTYVII